jgi:hypothetical protein
MSGLVIVLAPVCRDGDQWRRDLSALLGLSPLGDARFVVVDCGELEGLAIVEHLGPQIDIVDAPMQSESLREEMRCREDRAERVRHLGGEAAQPTEVDAWRQTVRRINGRRRSARCVFAL